MTSFKTFYLSRILGRNVYDTNGRFIGIVKDLLIDTGTVTANQQPPFGRPVVTGIKLRIKKEIKVCFFRYFEITKTYRKVNVTGHQLIELSEETVNNGIFLAKDILDRQIVDLNGRKLVRVNDIRLVALTEGTYAIAVDVGVEGLLRRIGVSRIINLFFSLFNLSLPAKFILWDDVEAVDFSNYNIIKLSKSYSKLHTLHPSDLADIIEDLGKNTSTNVFSALDEEKAADVLEELEKDAQIHIIESLPVEKVADVLEKMPADEVADILDVLEDEKAELLLNEMEAESSKEVREILEYADNTVGSLMNTEVISFNENKTIDEVINEFRHIKPEAEELYNLFVTDDKEELVATFSLRDLVVTDPNVSLKQIMKKNPIYLYDDQKIDDVAEIISKYNLLALPVVNRKNQLEGMVIIDDVVEDLIDKRRTNR
jgi:magnesium transporter